MPRGYPLSGISGALGVLRREDHAAYGRAYSAQNREKQRQYMRDYHNRHKDDPAYQAMKKTADAKAKRKAKFGLTDRAFKHMLTEQSGACSICREPFTKAPNVDHDHATGKVRGLLCQQCNYGLGNFKDEPARLQSAIAYLAKYK